MVAATISCWFCPAIKMKTEVLDTTLSAITGTPTRLPIQYALRWIIWIRQVIMKATEKAKSLRVSSNIPSNNDFPHMPWFHYDSKKAVEADIGVTKRLADFIFKHADKESDIYCRAEGLKDRYKQCGQVLLHGYPDYDPIALNISAFDPATYPSWLPLPVYFVGSPESSFYPECRHTVDMNLDTIIDSLLSTHEFPFPSDKELDVFEQSNPHPDGKRWCVL